MSDDNYVLVKYNGRRSDHRVNGRATKRSYGYHTHGDKFLVHKDDIRAQPGAFQVISDHQEDPIPVYEERKGPPPPKPVDTVISEPDEADTKAKVVEKMISDSNFDLRSVPGVTDRAYSNLVKARLTVPEAILEAGIDGLTDVKYIGKSRAEKIYNHVEERYG